MKRLAHKGNTSVDVVFGIACAMLLSTVAALALGAEGNGAETRNRSLKDATSAKLIHQSFCIFANEFDGIFPRPGLMDRLPVEFDGRMQDIPGRGDEDVTQNTTANLFSALITQNYFNPDLVVSPVERNPKVKKMEDYSWEAYDPAKDTYWDDDFAADLKAGSNVSYAHLPMFGERGKKQWRSTFDAKWVILGNRGPLAGEPDWQSYTCGPHGNWAGNVVFHDNHTEMLDTMTPKQVVYKLEELERPDNIFAMETGPAGYDVIITFTKKIGKEKLEIQHD
jgi:hypothetical protein